MTSTKLEYQKRLNEVELYFRAIELLDKGECFLNCTDILGNNLSQKIDSELSKILKANGFLLLYNLVEATVRNSIGAIFISMHSSHVTFASLTDKLRKLWIRQEFKHIDSDEILLLTNKILNNELLTFKAECISISGNIDAQKIREILKQFGCAELKDGRDLATIKEKRNKLAHGELTFSEIGKDYSMAELIVFKDNTKEYLSNVLNEIEAFINNKGYSL